MSALEIIESLERCPLEEVQMVRDAADSLLVASKFSPQDIAEIEAACEEGRKEYERGEFFTAEQMKSRLGL